MKLQILIPHYHETLAEIRPLLDSIALQQSVDFNEVGVIICHDGEDIPLLSLPEYPFKVEQISIPHRGVSAARNACLDHATADYVMFCDADDMFLNVCGLYVLFREIDGDGFDSLISVFVEETRDPAGNIVYINRNMDGTFVHGKVHRRQYLIDNKIRWNDALTVHEDSYFNTLCQKMTKEVKYCQQPFYLWKWRDNSVCRHDKKYILKTYNNMLDSSTALVNELLSRHKKADARFYAVGMIYDAYYTMNKREWIDQENKEYRDATERRFARYWKDFKALHDATSDEEKTRIIAGVRTRMFEEGLMLESVTFDDWIKTIEAMQE